VWTLDHDAVAAAVSVDDVEPARWDHELDELLLQVGRRFARRETRRHVSTMVRGMLAGLARVNCWTIAEHAGLRRPDGLQHVLSAAAWDEDGVRDDLRDYVVLHLAGPDPSADVLVIDETGDVKKGSGTVGVQRQYTGTAGRIENSQVAVYLAYAGAVGHAFIDRELYLPKAWTNDPDRCAAVGVPDDVEFATKPALAKVMLERAVGAGVRARWVAGDEVYGADPDLRRWCRSQGLGYVLAVARSHQVVTGIGSRRAVDLAVRPDLAWQRISAGAGAKGHRWYDWALIDLTDDDSDHDQQGGSHGLLVRRARHGELAFYRVWTPIPVPISQLVRVAGRRWAIEESFQAGKGLAGLDEHQVRRWTSWRRWTILAMLAHAFLAVTAASHQPFRSDTDSDTQAVIMTCGEVRHLLAALILIPVRAVEHVLAWSRFRQVSAARARASHYARQAAALT
jgi:SRSO17 transposase